MTTEHRRPLIAFIGVTMLCAFVVVNGLVFATRSGVGSDLASARGIFSGFEGVTQPELLPEVVDGPRLLEEPLPEAPAGTTTQARVPVVDAIRAAARSVVAPGAGGAAAPTSGRTGAAAGDRSRRDRRDGPRRTRLGTVSPQGGSNGADGDGTAAPRPEPTDEKPSKAPKPEKAEKPQPAPKPEKAPKPDKPEKAPKPEKTPKPDKPEKAPKPEKTPKPAKADKPEKTPKPPKADKPEKAPKPDKAPKPPKDKGGKDQGGKDKAPKADKPPKDKKDKGAKDKSHGKGHGRR